MSGFSLDLAEGYSGFTQAIPADGCTQCGICLSVCPTFAQTRDVEQSPMGRIRMMRALESGETEGMALEKLDSCLGCYACATSCPSKVRYGQMLDQALVTLRGLRPSKPITRWMLWLSRRPALIRRLIRLVAVTQFIGLRGLLRNTGVLSMFRLTRADRLLGLAPFPRSRPSNRLRRPRYDQRVSLFTGCFSSALEQELQQSSITVLNALGYEVLIPETQTCCGALHRHNGDSDAALRMARQNIQAFNAKPTTTILSTSSGCGASLQEYGSWLGLESTPFKQAPMDISHYLALVLRQRRVLFNTLRLRVAIHIPCTLRQHVGQANALLELLQMIPGVELLPLSGTPRCCGAGGSQMLSEPQLADGLRDQLIDEVVQLQPDLLLSSNLGCAMHLRAGLRQAGMELPVLHPVQLLEQALTMEFVSVARKRVIS